MPYRDPGTYRRPRRHVALVNRAVARLAALGLTPENTICLKVRGRRSGRMRRTHWLSLSWKGADSSYPLAGESEWVRNVRANGNRASRRRPRAHPVCLFEVPLEDRPPVLKAYLSKRACSKSPEFEAREFFGVPPDATLDQLAHIADRYPVFRIQPR